MARNSQCTHYPRVKGPRLKGILLCTVGCLSINNTQSKTPPVNIPLALVEITTVQRLPFEGLFSSPERLFYFVCVNCK